MSAQWGHGYHTGCTETAKRAAIIGGGALIISSLISFFAGKDSNKGSRLYKKVGDRLVPLTVKEFKDLANRI